MQFIGLTYKLLHFTTFYGLHRGLRVLLYCYCPKLAYMKKIYLVLLMAFPLITFGQELVSINDTKPLEVKGFKMYPNPAYGDEVYITTETNGTKEIQIFDVFGEVVLHERIATNTLNISKLVPGVYVLQVTEDKKTMTRKLVIK